MREEANQTTVAAATANLGNVYRTRGDLSAAEAMYKKALALHEALGRREGMASDYGNLGALAEQRGNMAEACGMWKQALALFRQVGMEPQIAEVQGWKREAGCPE